MKRLTFVVLLAGLLVTTNGCGILKTKNIEKAISNEKIANDVNVNKVQYDTSKSAVETSKENETKFNSEEINIKQPIVPENVEISANFMIDTALALKGDTLKLINIKNNNVTLSIYQNGKTKELMAKVTTNYGNRIFPASEINIKRQYSRSNTKTDSLAIFENHSEIKMDSVDKTKTQNQNKGITREEIKESKPNVWIWFFGIAIAAILIYFLLRRK